MAMFEGGGFGMNGGPRGEAQLHFTQTQKFDDFMQKLDKKCKERDPGCRLQVKPRLMGEATVIIIGGDGNIEAYTMNEQNWIVTYGAI